MKHQYFGDVNDYVKYGLLRVLRRVTGLRPGVVWMLTPDGDRPDGSRTSYWRDPAWREHDPELFDRLARLATSPAARGVDLFRRWDLVPGAGDFAVELPENGEARIAWMAAAVESLAEYPLLFFDPDNGLEVDSVPYGARGSTRYLYWDEAAVAWEAGHSLLVYQHYPRERRDAFEDGLCERAKARLPGSAITLLRSAHALFLLAARPAHSEALARAAGEAGRVWAGRLEVSARAAGADRAGDIAAVCEALSQRGPAAAAETLAERFPGLPRPVGQEVPEPQALRVWLRDGFLDRYDGARLVFPGTLWLLSILLPATFPFRPGDSASETHPAWWSLCPTVDRVVPLTGGGRDEPANWATTSRLHASAKSHWTLGGLGWSLKPAGSLEHWDGLCGWFRATIASRPELLAHEPIARWAAWLEQASEQGNARA